MKKFNPNFKEWLENHQDISLVGLSWSLYWRIALVVMGGYVVALIFLAGLAALAE
jgi:hypothetical protein